jgi:hypothetical protein
VAELASAAVASGRTIGRYFVVISMVPSLLFVAYIYGLLAAGASGYFDPVKAVHAAEHLSVIEIVALVLAALLLGLVLHPFQFPMTQFLEGYWGDKGIGQKMARRRIKHYRSLAFALEDDEDEAREAWRSAARGDRTPPAPTAHGDLQESGQSDEMWLDSWRGDPGLAAYWRAEAARAARGRYPLAARRIMPTRLGNVLRRYEDMAGQQYGLNIMTVAPHLNLVAAKEHRDYVDDCRQGLDLGVRICVLFALATALTVGLLADDGAWLLLALAPYCVSYLAYRGAISSAEDYGAALSYLVDLNRFALYDQLHVPSPPNSLVEKERNERLMRLLSGEVLYVRYTDPSDTSGTSGVDGSVAG